MHRIALMTLVVFLDGCGIEVAGTAAVGAAAKVQEAKQAQQNVERFQQKLDSAMQTGQARATEAEKVLDY